MIELLLALAILVAILGIVWPSVGRFLGEQPIKEATELTRRHLGGGRHKAMSTGLIYQFRYEPQGQRFIVLPFELDAAQVTENSTVATNTVTTAESFPVVSGELALTCQFSGPATGTGLSSGGPVTEQIPAELLALLPNGNELAGVSWSTPVLFYPDGTADDFTVDITDDDKRRMTLQLRGLTASVTVGKLTRDRGL